MSCQGTVLASELGAPDIRRQTSALLKIASYWWLFFVLWFNVVTWGGVLFSDVLPPLW